MKVAYLLLAHHQPKHLARLIKALNGEGCAFFVHIDAKVSEEEFRKAVAGWDNVHFVEQRTKVHWGGYSMVRATLSLLIVARQSGVTFDRYCLLSGSDFPIKSKEVMMKALGSDREFLRIDRCLNTVDSSGFGHRIRFYYFNDLPFRLRKLFSRRIRREPFAGIRLYHGSQWWSLTGGAVDYIFEFLAANHEYERFMKYVHCPDETFFHSILKDSPFADHLTHDFDVAGCASGDRDQKEHGAHYINWPAGGGRHPKTLESADYEELMASGALFARKFDEQRSAELIAMLESGR